MSLLGPVVEPGPRRRPAEPQIVGSNPTRPATFRYLERNLVFLTPSVCSMILPPIFSRLPREATEITRDTCVAMDSCCRGQMGVGVSANRQIRKSWFRQVSHSTHPYGRPKGWFLVRKSFRYDDASLFHIFERNRVNTVGAYQWVSTP